MLDVVIILTFIVLGSAVGFHGVELLPSPVLSQVENLNGLRWVTAGSSGLLGLALGLLAQSTYRRLERNIKQLSSEILISRSVGLVLGLLVANLLLAPTFLLPLPSEVSFIKPVVAVLSSMIFSVLGMNLADVHGQTIIRLINPSSLETMLLADGTLKPAVAKILDTSCIIDGRIEELLQTAFLEGQILVPQFVLQELQGVADAANDQKRTRGRRGLDLLQRLRERYPERVVIHSADYDEVPTVDAKLVRLAQDINGALLTTDYNLNKVANVQQVQVLNVNDLAQSLRPVYLPGDSLDLKILKEGKEPDQGIGYLADGTMVVVEDGESHIGKKLSVVVTSALQTSAGRMIFARPVVSSATL
ncbi:PIN/TRAM domain-containing protein [Lyngbya confervoides]|uniref:PIN/TRAM domain-containing protein n=1 Tax=Lyngbya confervoides BDU141951 TaxID=1574623 RepID=A0ABD4T806_9CYAN|nr:PIN/TRAM domain-containing protein [Lyngbya confervoides]MCM1984400.1 PIN/TRAM domain-containing protein [Lyngbya confervoides BDU141951]